MRRLRSRTGWCLALLLAAGLPGCRCGEPTAPGDSGVKIVPGYGYSGPDVGVDAGPADAGDAGAAEADAGADAGAPDAGADAGAPDAGADAGAPDAGADAGAPDAGAKAARRIKVDQIAIEPTPPPAEPPRPSAESKKARHEAQEAAKEPELDRTRCASCHAGLTAGQKPHGAIEREGCKGCHEPDGERKGKCQSVDANAWQLLAPPVELCQKCHEDTAVSGKLHPAIISGGCIACHEPHASKNPKLMKVWPLGKSCVACHEHQAAANSVHTPVKNGDCKGCHDPHSSEFAPLLVVERGALCQRCHKPEALKQGKATHTPVTERRCDACHTAHTSKAAPLLRETGRALCLKCHDQRASGPAAARPAARVNLDKRVVHEPLQKKGDCQACHTQKHGAPSRALLQTATTAETCFKCHKTFDNLAFQHGAVKTGKCTGCHDPHSSSEPGLLLASKQRQLCFLCHKDDLTGRRVVHKPIKEKGCTACHGPHGAQNSFDLVAGEGKDLCYSCHKQVDDVQYPHAAVTRYGCAKCHDPHASDNAKLLSSDVNTLCVSCHEKQKTGEHVGSNPPHKVAGGSDPKHKEKEFSCVSCHSPHGSDYKGGFYFRASGPQGICIYCHGDKNKKKEPAK